MSNSKELKVKYHGNKEKPSRVKNPNVASMSKLGYRDDSPYNTLPYIDIHTPSGHIDMSGTGIPLWANGRILPPYSGVHQFDTTQVKEIPLAQKGKEMYNMQRAIDLGYQPNEEGHWPSADYETGEWLKSKEHDTAWKEYLYGYTLNPQQALNYNVQVNPEGYFGENTLQYVPNYQGIGPYPEMGEGGSKLPPHLPEAYQEGGSNNWLKEYQSDNSIVQTVVENIPSWANPMNWGVSDYSDKGDFNKAYTAAKKAGEEEFMWNGKRFNTKYAGTPRQEIGAYGVNGRPVHPMDQNSPSQVNLYPMFGKYEPGHVSAAVTNEPESASVDYSKAGNFPFGIGSAKRKGERSYYVYGADQNKIYDKALSLPMGEFGWLADENESKPSDWNLLSNNCADNVCDAYGIPRSEFLETPGNTVKKIKEKYPTLDVTGRTLKDYYDYVDKTVTLYERSLTPLGSSFNADIMLSDDKLLNIYYSPDTPSDIKDKIGFWVQTALENDGYALPKSTNKRSGALDGVIGPETEKAIKEWRSKGEKPSVLKVKKTGGSWLNKYE